MGLLFSSRISASSPPLAEPSSARRSCTFSRHSCSSPTRVSNSLPSAQLESLRARYDSKRGQIGVCSSWELSSPSSVASCLSSEALASFLQDTEDRLLRRGQTAFWFQTDPVPGHGIRTRYGARRGHFGALIVGSRDTE